MSHAKKSLTNPQPEWNRQDLQRRQQVIHSLQKGMIQFPNPTRDETQTCCCAKNRKVADRDTKREREGQTPGIGTLAQLLQKQLTNFFHAQEPRLRLHFDCGG